jgi:hypothetical protein
MCENLGLEYFSKKVEHWKWGLVVSAQIQTPGLWMQI